MDWDRLCDRGLDVAVSPTAIAYIIYASGSTDKPKGVYQNHRNVLHNCTNQINAFEIAQQSIEQRHRFEFVGPIDGLLYPYSPNLKHRLASVGQLGAFYVGRKVLSSARHLAKQTSRKLCRPVPAAGANVADNGGDRVFQRQKDRDFFEAYTTAKRNYVPRHYDAHVRLLSCKEWQFADLSPLRQIVGDGLTVQVINGLHDYLFDSPYVEELAEVLQGCLTAAATRH